MAELQSDLCVIMGRDRESLLDFNDRKIQLASFDRSNNFVATVMKHFKNVGLGHEFEFYKMVEMIN